MFENNDIAVLIPCFNEAPTISGVVEGFGAALPGARIYVYDNNSTDDTVTVALNAGATVRQERKQGKGNVVKRMFADVEAEIYIMVDGDGTYDPGSAPEMVKLLVRDGLDMVVAVREARDDAAYRSGHVLGNMAFNNFFRYCFGNQFTDILSGYRVFSRRYLKSFPALSTGFEIETEISIHAHELDLPTAEVKSAYFSRPEDSHSKLSTYFDGFRIGLTIIRLYKEIYPLRFFAGMAMVLAVVSVLLGTPIFVTFVETGLVPRYPTAILCTGLMLLSGIAFTCGLIVQSVTRGRLEQKRLWYLSQPRSDSTGERGAEVERA